MKTIDPKLQLAHSIYNSKGCYILLLGSGVSRPANLRTGWEITIDIARQLLNNTSEAEDKVKELYEKEYGKELNYSNVIEALCPCVSNRKDLLKKYFEPDDSNGVQHTTKAHEAIAKLVEKGYIKIIITTNFDKLMENALSELNIVHVVIDIPDKINGVKPISNQSCVIIKVNGDYLSSALNNTHEELYNYDHRMVEFLKQLFDDYGLVVSGWSASYDIKLTELVKICTNNRLCSYWGAVNSEHTEAAKVIIQRRKCVEVIANSADDLFTDVYENVLSIESYHQHHPLAKLASIESAKRYITQDKYRVKFFDLVNNHIEALISNLGKIDAPSLLIETPDKIINVLSSNAEILYSLAAIWGFWTISDDTKVWENALKTLYYKSLILQNYSDYLSMSLLTTLGMALISRGRLDIFGKILSIDILICDSDKNIVKSSSAIAAQKFSFDSFCGRLNITQTTNFLEQFKNASTSIFDTGNLNFIVDEFDLRYIFCKTLFSVALRQFNDFIIKDPLNAKPPTYWPSQYLNKVVFEMIKSEINDQKSLYTQLGFMPQDEKKYSEFINRFTKDNSRLGR